ncbi:hypothetical protein BWQ96_01260 [Gracilariopsis chorda]|uniref:Uncharacterized protein n=1 Tax=Gracilariopsis chorda TaxID=448386 RepID=A0A2V3J3D4_9FLOR|nr:hypothetical protein BWQ96_01260 [Gracilariopsis chorda]|eukprot:PXF48918.1 hypothetical protein BWQ96_01260 [Gracilariopsis chorda]
MNNAQNSSLPGAVLLLDVPPPLSEPLNLDALLGTKKTEENQANTTSSNVDHSPPHKKAKKFISVGGILIIDENGKSTPNRPPRLGPYPRNSTQKPLLYVTELVAFKLLRGLLQKGCCLESTVADVQWFRGQKRELMAAEAEAHFLARILHLGLQDFDRMERHSKRAHGWKWPQGGCTP